MKLYVRNAPLSASSWERVARDECHQRQKPNTSFQTIGFWALELPSSQLVGTFKEVTRSMTSGAIGATQCKKWNSNLSHMPNICSTT